MRILIAEDERVTRTALARQLQSWGHEVISTEDGQQAWEQFEATPEIDIVISDWEMPRVSGVELVRHREVDRDPSPDEGRADRRQGLHPAMAPAPAVGEEDEQRLDEGLRLRVEDVVEPHRRQGWRPRPTEAVRPAPAEGNPHASRSRPL